MKIEITDLTEAQVENLTDALGRHFEYDVDFTTLYRGQWVMCGVTLMGERTAAALEEVVRCQALNYNVAR